MLRVPPIAAGLLALATAAPAATEPDGLDLEPFRGQVVLVDFWASWCGPCAESFPWMAEMMRRYDARGLVVVAVSVDTDREAAERFLAGRDWPFRIVYDPAGRLAEAQALRTMPTSLLFDRSGRLVGRHEGFRSDEAERYERNLVALLDGQPLSEPPAPETRPASRRRGVRPWQRGLLAQRAMWLDADPLDLELDDHIYFSKESSSGGRSFGGGGCGCN